MNSIRLGLSATLSGSLSLQGIDSFNGLTLWSEYQNSLGGIYVKDLEANIPVELVYFDDESDPSNTKEITRRLINEEKVDLILGPYSSSLSLACAGESEIHGRVLWNYGGSTDEIIGENFPNTITFITPASRYLEPYLELIKKRYKKELTVAIVYAEDSGFSRQVSGGAISFCIKNGITHKTFTYKSGMQDFSKIISLIKDSSLNAIIGVGRFGHDLNFARHLNGINACLPGAAIDQFKIKLGDRCNGFCSISQWEPGANTVPDFGIESSVFTQLYTKRFGKIPDYVSAQSFNMGNILSYFIEKTGTLDEHKLKEEIMGSRFKTFYGNFSSDNSFSGHKTLAIQWQNGKKEIIYPPEYSTSELVDPL